MEDAGWFDVFAQAGPNDEEGVNTYAGRYSNFLAASTVAEKLNDIWRLIPGASARDVIVFATASATELLAALKVIIEACRREGSLNSLVAQTARAAIAKAEDRAS